MELGRLIVLVFFVHLVGVLNGLMLTSYTNEFSKIFVIGVNLLMVGFVLLLEGHYVREKFGAFISLAGVLILLVTAVHA